MVGDRLPNDHSRGLDDGDESADGQFCLRSAQRGNLVVVVFARGRGISRRGRLRSPAAVVSRRSRYSALAQSRANEDVDLVVRRARPGLFALASAHELRAMAFPSRDVVLVGLPESRVASVDLAAR